MTTIDSVAAITLTSNINRFVQATTRAIRASIQCRASGPVLVYPWQAGFDQVIWTLTK
jgi:hypothetical protein